MRFARTRCAVTAKARGDATALSMPGAVKADEKASDDLKKAELALGAAKAVEDDAREAADLALARADPACLEGAAAPELAPGLVGALGTMCNCCGSVATWFGGGCTGCREGAKRRHGREFGVNKKAICCRCVLPQTGLRVTPYRSQVHARRVVVLLRRSRLRVWRLRVWVHHVRGCLQGLLGSSQALHLRSACGERLLVVIWRTY